MSEAQPPELVRQVCCDVTCGVVFGLPQHVNAQARALGMARTFSCPNGHKQGYQETEVDRLKKRVVSLEAGEEGSNARYHRMEEEADRQQRRIVSLRGVITRLQRKLAARAR